MKTKQRGFTLVELLITLAVSSALAAGLGQILLQSKNTYKTQLNLSHMMEDGRYILEVLTKETRRIGFLRNRHATYYNNAAVNAAVGNASTIFRNDPNVLNSAINLSSGEFISGAYNGNGFNGSYDINKLVFRYQLNDASELSATAPDYASSPCTRNIGLDPGDDPTMDIHVVSIYFYVDFDNDSKTPVLYCRAKRDVFYSDGVTPPSTVPNDVTALPLLSNVERFLVLYGIDTDTPTDNAANIYLRADSVTDWTRVVSIRLYVVLGSEETHVAKTQSGYHIDGQSFSPDTPDDKRLYRVFSTTITLRNY